MTSFATAMIEAGAEQVLGACSALRLDDNETAFVLARHRRCPDGLDLVLVMGGGLGDYVRQLRECYRVETGRWRGGSLR